MKISYNISILESLDEGDSQFMKDMIHLLIESTGSGLKEMKEHLSKKDYIALAEKAHKVVGPCKQIELMPLSETIKCIEKDIFDNNKFDRIPELISQAELEFEASAKILQKYL